MKRLTRLLSVLLILLALVLALAACSSKNSVIHTAEEIEEAMTAETDTDKKYAVDYLVDWKLPGLTSYTKSKIRKIENIYRDYYVKEVPDAYTMAKGTTALFLEVFYDEIDLKNSEEVTDGLITCYVETIGDPYSFYRTAIDFEDYETDMSGEFAGIGVNISYDAIDNIMTVTSVMIGSGAEDAGILVGDLLKTVDGKSIDELGYNKFINSIRGKEGTRVKVEVERNGEMLEFDIERKHIVEETVTYNIDENNIGYIKITDFKEITETQFKEAIDYMEEKGAIGVIYDLRGNPGGYLHTVVNMLSYIIPKGTEIVSFSNNYSKPLESNNDHKFYRPSVVLCDGSTASAGELFTASMRDFGTGDKKFFDTVIVGTQTYGKGVMQTSISLTDGSAITFTVAYYNPPSGENYDEVGIKPNRKVENDPNKDGDEQLIAAIEEINKLIKAK